MYHHRLIATILALALTTLTPVAGLAQQGPDPKARPDLVRGPYNEADVAFMQGMIPHHAQAVVMAKMAKTHGAREDVRILCERILVAQSDEITLMRNWLRDRGQVVPAADATHHKHMMNGVAHDMLMPGMLTPEEMAALDKARGPEWDRLFLAGMIKHHEGALSDGRRSLRGIRRAPGRRDVQVRVRRLRRPDDRDRFHAEDARRDVEQEVEPGANGAT